MLFARLQSRVGMLLGATLMLAACEKSASNSQSSATATSTASGGATGTSTATGATGQHTEDFCKAIANLKLRADITVELAILCGGTTATTMFKDLYGKGLTNNSGKMELLPISVTQDDSGFSHVTVAWSFLAPTKVADLRNAPILDLLGAAYSSETIEQTTKVERKSDDSLDPNLHILSADFSYEMRIKNSKGLELANKRNTQYNLYQVQGGNENLGLAVEHLTDTDNEDYKRATMVNVALSAADGNGAVIVTVLNFSLFNRNFHSTAVDSINEIAKHAGAAMFKALQ